MFTKQCFFFNNNDNFGKNLVMSILFFYRIPGHLGGLSLSDNPFLNIQAESCTLLKQNIAKQGQPSGAGSDSKSQPIRSWAPALITRPPWATILHEVTFQVTFSALFIASLQDQCLFNLLWKVIFHITDPNRKFNCYCYTFYTLRFNPIEMLKTPFCLNHEFLG